MRKVPRSCSSGFDICKAPASALAFTVLLTGAFAMMAIAADESYAQGRYSARSTRSQPAASSGGFFGTLFGGGAPRYRTPYSGAYGYYNSYGYYNQSYQGYGRYRTLCVRTCDGYYYPVSYSTTRASFARDDKQCRSSCAVPARLFVYRNPGADVQNMVDLKGKPYSQMENAFRYRKEYVKDCRCTPEPWSKAAKLDYARRETLEAAPSQVKTATVEEKATHAAAAPEPVAFSAGQYSQARAQNTRRSRYRNNEARRYDGQWWAGSW